MENQDDQATTKLNQPGDPPTEPVRVQNEQASPGGTKSDSPRRSHTAAATKRQRQKLVRLGLFGLLVAVIIAAYLSASGPDTTTKPGSKDGAFSGDGNGKTAVRAAKAGEVRSVANLDFSYLRGNSNYRPADPAAQPDAGNRFVAAEFTVTNKDSRAVKIVRKERFKLRDSTDTIYLVDEKWIAAAPAPQFPESVLEPGKTAQGWLIFQVPTGAKNFTLYFDAAAPRVG